MIVFLEIVGTAILAAALYFNWKAADSANDSAKSAAEALQANRAWVTYDGKGSIGKNGQVLMKLKNTSLTPATNLSFSIVSTVFKNTAQIPKDEDFDAPKIMAY